MVHSLHLCEESRCVDTYVGLMAYTFPLPCLLLYTVILKGCSEKEKKRKRFYVNTMFFSYSFLLFFPLFNDQDLLNNRISLFLNNVEWSMSFGNGS